MDYRAEYINAILQLSINTWLQGSLRTSITANQIAEFNQGSSFMFAIIKLTRRTMEIVLLLYFLITLSDSFRAYICPLNVRQGRLPWYLCIVTCPITKIKPKMSILKDRPLIIMYIIICYHAECIKYMQMPSRKKSTQSLPFS